jgi:hypothetical protein
MYQSPHLDTLKSLACMPPERAHKHTNAPVELHILLTCTQMYTNDCLLCTKPTVTSYTQPYTQTDRHTHTTAHQSDMSTKSHDTQTHSLPTREAPTSASPLLLTHSAHQDQHAEEQGGPGPEPASWEGHFWLLCPSVPLGSALQAWGVAGCTEKSPPLSNGPHPLAGLHREVTIRGHARPWWPPSFPLSQCPGLIGGRSLFGFLH